MKQVKGIVTKISGNKCIILTAEGEFRRLPLPKGPVRVGQEVSCSTGIRGLSRYATLAACLLLVLVGMFSLQQPASADPAAYVSLDINPSLELAVNAEYKVIGVKTLNQDAKQLLEGIEYQNRDVYQVLSEILQKAIDLKYVSSGKSNLVVSSVVEMNPKVHLDTGRLQKAVAQPLKAKNLKVSVLFFKADKAEREQADNLQLSTGKYVFFKEDKESASHANLDYYKTNSLSNMADQKKLKMPVKRMKMVISDTSDWNEETSLPSSSKAISQNYKWANDASTKGVEKLNSKPRKAAKSEDGSEDENSARVHSPANDKSNNDSGQTNLKEKDQEKEKEKARSQEQNSHKGNDKETGKQRVKENSKEEDQVKGKNQDSTDESEHKNKTEKQSKDN